MKGSWLLLRPFDVEGFLCEPSLPRSPYDISVVRQGKGNRVAMSIDGKGFVGNVIPLPVRCHECIGPGRVALRRGRWTSCHRFTVVHRPAGGHRV